MKSTYGTGCFILLNTGEKRIKSRNRLLTTIAYRLNNQIAYALEGSIFTAGAAVQWLRDGLHLIDAANKTEAMATSIENTGGVYLVPAFTGLGAPYWDPQARGAILGLTRDTGIKQIVRAALEAACYQTNDLIAVMIADGAQPPAILRVDGGMVENHWLLQFLADILQIAVEKSSCIETSALGAAFFAGLQVGFFKSLAEISALRPGAKIFKPQMNLQTRNELCRVWKVAVEKIIS